MEMPTVQNKLQAKWISLSATVLSSSLYGLEYDRLKVLHEVCLESPLSQDETFYVPHPDRVIDTRTLFPDGSIVNFAGQRFTDLQDELSQYADAVRLQDAERMDSLNQLFKATAMLGTVLFKQGTQVLTFEYEMALFPTDNVYEINLWAPLPSFGVATGGQVTVSVQLPSPNHPEFRTSILESSGFQPDPQGNPLHEVPKILDSDLGLRHIIVWHWQNDPLFKVRYNYNR